MNELNTVIHSNLLNKLNDLTNFHGEEQCFYFDIYEKLSQFLSRCRISDLNIGRLVRGDLSRGFVPPSASAVLDLLEKHGEFWGMEISPNALIHAAVHSLLKGGATAWKAQVWLIKWMSEFHYSKLQWFNFGELWSEIHHGERWSFASIRTCVTIFLLWHIRSYSLKIYQMQLCLPSRTPFLLVLVWTNSNCVLMM